LYTHAVLTVGFPINDRSDPVRLEAIWTSADKLNTGDNSKEFFLTIVASYNYIHFTPNPNRTSEEIRISVYCENFTVNDNVYPVKDPL